MKLSPAAASSAGLNLNLGTFYIGSAICLYTRFKSHKVNSMRPKRGGDNAFYLAVRESGWSSFT